MRSILVTRPQPIADEFADTLRREGFTAYVAPLLEYVEVSAEFSNLSSYQAFVFTSAQAVQFFARRTAERSIPVLAVGDATAAAAARCGFVDIHSAQGDSDDITELLLSKKADLKLKKVLHPCSEDTPSKIDRAVTSAGIKVMQKVIYRAKMLNNFPDDVHRALQQHSIDTVTLFSSRTAENLVKLLKQRDMQGVSAKLEAICISDRVADNLVGLPWKAVRVARQPQMEAVLDVLKNNVQNRRNSDRRDRRQQSAPRNESGFVQSGTYTGPDRRSGIDRRAYEKMKNERVLKERMRFINGAILTFTFVVGSILIASFFLMGPEYGSLKKLLQRGADKIVMAEASMKDASFGGMLNSQIEEIGNMPTPQIAQHVLMKMDELRASPAGIAAAEQSMRTIRAMLAMAPDNPHAINQAISDARQRDPTIDALFRKVPGKDLAAAGMLLALSEFRRNVSSNRPYGEDLAMLQRFVGSDPEMRQALERLSPYAQTGTVGREALVREFNGFTKDILMAAVSGQDIAVKKRVLERFGRLSQAVRTGEVQGQTPEAVLARTKLFVGQGDIMGALQEMRGLNTDARAVAAPWMKEASGYVVAGQSSDILTRGILEAMGGGSGVPTDELLSAIMMASQKTYP